MILRSLLIAIGLVLATSGCSQGPDPAQLATASEIAWREGDVEDALAEAKEAGKPVLLYWGAVWCPPCNDMKANLFKEQSFIAQTQNFVPVYLDGDTDGAQRWAERFGIAGYPTVILLRPDGEEITRLSSSTMADELPSLLQQAAQRTTTIEALIAKAGDDPASLSEEDWDILAGFAWFNDPKHFSDLTAAGDLLGKLAANAPNPALQRRFGLMELVVAASPGKDGTLALTQGQRERLTSILPAMLANPQEVVANRYELLGAAPNLVLALPKGTERDRLRDRIIAAGDAVYANDKLNMVDRMNAIGAEIAFAKAAGGIGPELRAKVQTRAKWADANAKGRSMRESVIYYAAGQLSSAGDFAGAKKLLLAEMERSETPYYYMSALSSLAEEQGDKPGALEWAKKAYEAAEGPATRVQWAVNWALTALEVAPEDAATVEASARAVLAELAKTPDGYYQRTRTRVAGWGKALAQWSEEHGGAELLQDLRQEMAAICQQQGDQAKACGEWSRAA